MLDQLYPTTPLGAVVPTYTVAMKDGSPFTGTSVWRASYDKGGVFAFSAIT
jgi:hypothetical protein